MMDKFELQKLRDLPIEGVAERLNLRVERHKCLCPFHDDHHASMSFKGNKYRCWSCGESGDAISLTMKVLGKDFIETCRWLSDGAAFVITSYRHNDITTRERPPFDASRYERFFEHPFLNEAARKFLFEERRLDERVVRWCRLTSWRDRQGINWLQIPYYNQEGKLIGIQNRNLGPLPAPPLGECHNLAGQGSFSGSEALPQRGNRPLVAERLGSVSDGGQGGEGAPRFRFPQGAECGIYNLPVLNRLKPGETLYIAEGCSDCWSLLSAGHKAIAIPSATLLKKKDAEQLSIINYQLSIKFEMFPDNDLPGERLYLQLKEVLPSLQRHQLPPGCKDYSEYYLKYKTSDYTDFTNWLRH